MLAKDALLAVTLITSSALFLTNHAALAVGLARQHQPRWHVSFVLLPVTAWLAPYWGLRAGLRVRSVLWILSASVYLACQVVMRVTASPAN
jgi:hypothetical protein